MKKTISISLASTPFMIEDDAYEILDRYLTEVRLYFAKNTDEKEVVVDIEARIAEQFLESEKQIITKKEVGAVIASMGKVREFGGETRKDNEKTVPLETRNKHLYRNPDDKIIAGVASGIAAYLGIEVVWVRLAFVLLTIMDAFGILLYIAFWIAMPEAKTASQKLEMSGTPVTLETLVDRVKERVDEVKKDKGTLERLSTLPLAIIKGFFSFITAKLVPFIGKLIGFILGFVAIIAIIIISVVFGIFITHGGTEFSGIPLYAAVSQWMIVISAIFGFLALAIPFLFLIFFADILMERRRTITAPAAMALIGIWFVAIVTSAIACISMSAKISSYMSTSPLYQEKTKNIDSLAPFSEISAQNGVHVIYVQGTTTSVMVTGYAKDLSDIAITSNNNVLKIEPNKKNRPIFCLFCDIKVPSVTVTAPSVVKFKGENGVNLEGTGITSPSKISIFLSNGARGIFEVNASELSAEIKNGVYLELTGYSTSTTLAGENATHIDASGFSGKNADVNISNASSLEIGTTNILNAKAKNGASIRYAGTPIVTRNVQGGSSIETFL